MAIVASFVGTTDKRLWRVINHYVTAVMKRIDLSKLQAFSLDETACKSGQRYVIIFIGLNRDDRPVVFATEGKGKQTVEQFRKHLYNTHLYKKRHLVEYFFCKLKNFQRIATHYEKLTQTFLTMITIASCLIWLR